MGGKRQLKHKARAPATPAPPNADRLKNDGIRALANGMPEKAIEFYSQSLEVNPE